MLLMLEYAIRSSIFKPLLLININATGSPHKIEQVVNFE